MANRYWVGGTGTWNTSSTTNWSAATALSFTASRSTNVLTTTGSPALVIGMTVWTAGNVSIGTITGGSGNTWTTSGSGTVASQTMKAATVGASVPTAADSVFFDANSSGTSAYTVTQTGALLCLDFTTSALTPTFATGTTPTLAISGSMSLVAGTVWNSTGDITFNATATGKTVTTNGVTIFARVVFDGVGGGWTLGSSITTSDNFVISAGTFNTSVSNYAVSCTQFVVSGTATRTVNLNGSIITVSIASSLAFLASITTNLTFNAGTSQINLSSTTSGITSGGLTFYNVSFTSTALSAGTITGSNTFNNLTFTGRTTVGIGNVTFSADQIVNGTLTVSAGTAAAYRTFLASNTLGTTRTITVGTSVSLTDADFRDITAAGAAGTWTGTRLGDAKGNSNITFDSAKTVYYRATGSANWGATGSGSWSATSGGALNATQFPLAQDTAVFPAATYPSSGSTTTINAGYNIGTIDMSLRTANTMILATGTNSPFSYGDWINGSGITISGTNTITFAGRVLQKITAGSGFTQPITIDSPGGTFQLQDNFLTTNTRITTHTKGTIDLQSFTYTTGLFDSSNSNVRSIAFGTGNITVSGTGTVWSALSSTNLTTTGAQVVNVVNAGSTAITVSTGVLSESNSISFNFTAGTYALTFLQSASYSAKNVNFTGFAGTWNAIANGTIYGSLTLSTGMTLTASTFTLNFGATSGTKTITSNGKTMDFPITFDGVGGTWQLQDNMTVGSTRTTTLTNGSVNLQSSTLSTGLFSSSNSNVRSIAFGTGNITISSSGSGTVWTTATSTNLTTTGTQVVNVTNATATATTVNSGALSEASSISFNFTAGTYTLTFLTTAGYTAKNVNFTGFAGTWSATGTVTIYGNLTLSSGMTLSASANTMTFGATSGTKTITSNGKTMNFPVTFNGVGGTWQFQDALTLGSTRVLTLTAGTIDSFGQAVSFGQFGSSGSNIRAITFGGSTWTISSASWSTSGSNLTTSGTGTISMTSATSKTFSGGGFTWPTLNNGGAGAMVISGSNTFTNLTNTVQPTTFTFTSGTTNIFTNFSISGTAGNLVTLNSSSAGSQATLQKNQAWYMGANSVNVSNNTNLVFTAGAGIDYLSVRDIRGNQVGYLTSNFFAFFPS